MPVPSRSSPSGYQSWPAFRVNAGPPGKFTAMRRSSSAREKIIACRGAAADVAAVALEGEAVLVVVGCPFLEGGFVAPGLPTVGGATDRRRVAGIPQVHDVGVPGVDVQGLRMCRLTAEHIAGAGDEVPEGLRGRVDVGAEHAGSTAR